MRRARLRPVPGLPTARLVFQCLTSLHLSLPGCRRRDNIDGRIKAKQDKKKQKVRAGRQQVNGIAP